MARARRRKPIKSSFHDGSFPVFQEVSPTWKAIKQEQIFMDNTRTRRKPVSVEAIARHACEGRDVSRFFTNDGRMLGSIRQALDQQCLARGSRASVKRR
jgi:hypothetical protein